MIPFLLISMKPDFYIISIIRVSSKEISAVLIYLCDIHNHALHNDLLANNRLYL